MLKIKKILRNEEGINVLNDSFDDIELLGKYILVSNNKKFGLYSYKGFKQLFPCEWDKISIHENHIIAQKESKEFLFDDEGNKVLKKGFDKIQLFSRGILVILNKKRGFYDYNGKEILSCSWRRIELYNKALIAYNGNREEKKIIKYDEEKQTKQY